MNEDTLITCTDCSDEFTFTAGEQDFYATKGLNAPQRCKNCREVRKKNYEADKAAGRMNAGPKEMHDATCTTCGKQTQVPFKPHPTKPIYCLDCYKKMSPARH